MTATAAATATATAGTWPGFAHPLRARIGDCQGCGACLLTCPEHAIRPGAGTDRRLLVTAACTGCGECVEICPVDVVDLVAVDVVAIGATS